jgi:DnaJ-class molecular chaperone
MYNYYEILNVDITSDINNIKSNYKNMIKKYYNKYNLSFEEIKYIKIIKTGLHILSNNNLKNKYNILLFNNNKDDNNNIKQQDDKQDNNIDNNNDNKQDNYTDNYDNNNLNDIFNINNAWMKDIKTNDDDKKLDNNIINDRIFTLHNNKFANNEIDNSIRKPLSCRDNKKELN